MAHAPAYSSNHREPAPTYVDLQDLFEDMAALPADGETVKDFLADYTLGERIDPHDRQSRQLIRNMAQALSWALAQLDNHQYHKAETLGARRRLDEAREFTARIHTRPALYLTADLLHCSECGKPELQVELNELGRCEDCQVNIDLDAGVPRLNPGMV